MISEKRIQETKALRHRVHGRRAMWGDPRRAQGLKTCLDFLPSLLGLSVG